MIVVPKGKKVEILGSGKESIEGRTFHLESDLNLKLDSQYASLVDASAPKAITALFSGANDLLGTRFPSAGFKQLGFQQWQNTEPLAFVMDIGLYMEKSGYEDVVLPAKDFASLALPTEVENGGLVAPGPSALSMIFQNLHHARQNMMTIQFGSITIHSCIIYGVDWNFSAEVDENDHPIWCKMKCDCKTLFTANTGMLDSMFPFPIRG